ncbi:hypothetical protein WL94_23720 [Burkholderia cepacia]|nr:hypothetical protein WL94_23720 [Burkholderia cepacia]
MHLLDLEVMIYQILVLLDRKEPFGTSAKHSYQMLHFWPRLDGRNSVLYKDISSYSTVGP